MKARLYRHIASAVQARKTCIERGNTEWIGRWEERLSDLEAELPSGSGFDSGTEIDLDRSTPERLVLTTSFHHMNEHGYYDGWTDHSIVVTPSLVFEFNLRITGRERYRGGDWKDYCHETFQHVLGQEHEWTEKKAC